MPKGNPKKVLTKEMILGAQNRTNSNLAASRYLKVSYPHYKKYAKLYQDFDTGQTLFDKHKNQRGKGIPKVYNQGKLSRENLRKALETGEGIYSWSPKKLKIRIVQEGFLEEKCYACGFNEKRIIDYKSPLILSFRDGNLSNWKLDNLQFLCYNCYFLQVGNIFTEPQIVTLESYTSNFKQDQVDWEIDEDTRKYLDNLGGSPLKERDDDDDDFSDLIDYNDF